MRWENYHYFLLFLLIPLGIAFFIYADKARQKALSLFCDPVFISKLIPDFSWLRLILKQILRLGVLFFILLALVGPQWGYHFEEVIRKGSDVLLLVDVSNSMLAEDVNPNRLERAKRKIYDLLKMAQGDRMGMIVFAGKAALLVPLTLDYQAIYQFLDILSPDLISTQGTDLDAALELGLKSFQDPKTSKAMIIFTDGEDFNEDLESVISSLKQAKVILYILGFGTPEGAPIPLPKGEGGFKRDESGNIVISKLDETGLSRLAVATGGEYVRAVTSDADLKELYVKSLKGALSGSEIKSGKKRVYENRFQWPLGMAFLWLLAEMWIGDKRKT